MEYTLKRLWTKRNELQKKEWLQLLAKSDLKEEVNIDYTVGVYEGERLVATGSYQENIIKCISILPECRGGRELHMLISHLENEIRENGFTKFYIYTKPQKYEVFIKLGYKEIERVEGLIFLEKAVNGFCEYIQSLKKEKIEGKRIGAVVMNANPFTLGHQYLVETASQQCDVLHVFVVSQDRSVFPNKVRKELVIKGCSHLKNVWIHDTENYLVSSQTFPSYFLNEEENITEVQASLDARIFKNHIAPALGIQMRYVGEEPFSKVTLIYNEAMKCVFEDKIELIVLPRKEIDGEIISATQVREEIAEGEFECVKRMVPKTTYDFIVSKEAVGIVNHLKKEKGLKL